MAHQAQPNTETKNEIPSQNQSSEDDLQNLLDKHFWEPLRLCLAHNVEGFSPECSKKRQGGMLSLLETTQKNAEQEVSPSVDRDQIAAEEANCPDTVNPDRFDVIPDPNTIPQQTPGIQQD